MVCALSAHIFFNRRTQPYGNNNITDTARNHTVTQTQRTNRTARRFPIHHAIGHPPEL